MHLEYCIRVAFGTDEDTRALVIDRGSTSTIHRYIRGEEADMWLIDSVRFEFSNKDPSCPGTSFRGNKLLYVLLSE